MRNAHDAHDFQTCAYDSISCHNFLFLHPFFCHLLGQQFGTKFGTKLIKNKVKKPDDDGGRRYTKVVVGT